MKSKTEWKSVCFGKKFSVKPSLITVIRWEMERKSTGQLAGTIN